MVSPYFTKVRIMTLCKYAKNISTAILCNVICTKINDQCGMYRYCGQIGGPIMTDTYNKYGCNIERGVDSPMDIEKVVAEIIEKPVVEEAKPEKKQQKIKEVLCHVNYIKNGTSSISYNVNGKEYSMFIDGEYPGDIIIKYVGNVVAKENIKEIKRK